MARIKTTQEANNTVSKVEYCFGKQLSNLSKDLGPGIRRDLLGEKSWRWAGAGIRGGNPIIFKYFLCFGVLLPRLYLICRIVINSGISESVID